MRWSGLPVVVAVAACYAPRVPAGAPCPDLVCPDDQVCRGAVCVPAGAIADAPSSRDTPLGSDAPDGPSPPGDRDGDGVTDDVDNCPTIANADQANEDGDKLGDACDSCPVEADDSPSDPDGDGVTGSCDPHPNAAGDKLVLFEGFDHGVPASWTSTAGLWTDAGGGEVRVTAPLGITGYLSPPLVPSGPTGKETITARLVIETLTGTNDNDIGVDDPYMASSDTGISCEMYQPGTSGTGNRRVSLFDYVGLVEKGQHDLAWALNVPYVVSLARNSSNYDCTVTDAGNITTSAPGGSTSSVATPRFALRAYSTTARYSWVMIVTTD